MINFAYEARDDNGRLKVGVIEAESREHAGRLLSQNNLFVVRMAADRARQSRAARASSGGHATREQIAWCMSQLSIMVETRIRLVDALDCLARQASKPGLKALLQHVSKTVQEGRPLSEAMRMHPRAFPSSLVALIRASELCGTMGQVLHRSASYLMNDLQVIRRVRGAMLYPAFMFLVCLTVTIFLLTAILPRFAGVFASRGAILPLPTRILMDVSDHLIACWPLWAGVSAALVLGAAAWSKTLSGRRRIDRMLLRLPVISETFRYLYQSRMFRTMAVLLEAGVSLIDAIRVVQDVVPNTRYRDLWQQVDAEIQRGERIAGPLLNSNLIPESVAQMIDSGDRSGKLGVVFARLADFMEHEYDRAIKTATQFIEPCMIMCMGGIVGFIAAALMLPLFQAANVIAH